MNVTLIFEERCDLQMQNIIAIAPTLVINPIHNATIIRTHQLLHIGYLLATFTLKLKSLYSDPL